MVNDVEVGVTMERRRQSAVYSPGGCGCGLLLLPVIAVSIGVMLALAGLAAVALDQCGMGRLFGHRIPVEHQLSGALCPVDDQRFYRGIRHGGLILPADGRVKCVCSAPGQLHWSFTAALALS